ncbi:hypothetical protein G3578_17940 [Brevibacillus sp. SYP-B805]|uniref:Flp family type IVb pilin n=1 Tax=Brevibacillus sp. SYP-B805 TaxID=1578199 RepID=UPI0013EB9789|nr:hypothetical protein [Brevibacillus sp. SYP-B805]NGQ97047.1 hypothetical protein [Brevibacillus sp. SYP-B805]
MTSWMQKMYVKVTSPLHNEKGAQAIEWIALAGVVMAILGAVSTLLSKDELVGNAVANTLKKIIEKIGNALSGS